MIPREVIDDTDNDWIIPQDQKEREIEDYLAGQQEAEAAMYGDVAKPPGKK